jgi:hypothetical protein
LVPQDNYTNNVIAEAKESDEMEEVVESIVGRF